MIFGQINFIAVLVAAIAGFAIGGVYYGVLARPWRKAARLDPVGKPLPSTLVISFVCEVVLSIVLAGIVGHTGAAAVTLSSGIAWGFMLWLGFVATTLVVNQRYEGFGWDLTLIDAAHWLLVLLAMGAIIGGFGV